MTVKVADFGFSENLYTRAYVRIVMDGGVKLPVKWMAPESILDGVFSEKTDVVCYYTFIVATSLFTCHAFSTTKPAYSYTHFKSTSAYIIILCLHFCIVVVRSYLLGNIYWRSYPIPWSSLVSNTPHER